ncbi:hypothetical protein ABVG11_31210 [Streptomyces sp. HD1123-B1]|uniref:hypothetical protein n=1 Tax=Streptomyces huangiella TaxID=3228804 RepID=UPI003D7EFD5A
MMAVPAVSVMVPVLVSVPVMPMGMLVVLLPAPFHDLPIAPRPGQERVKRIASQISKAAMETIFNGSERLTKAHLRGPLMNSLRIFEP